MSHQMENAITHLASQHATEIEQLTGQIDQLESAIKQSEDAIPWFKVTAAGNVVVSSKRLLIQTKFNSNIEDETCQTGSYKNGSLWYLKNSRWVDIEGGQVRIQLEKRVLDSDPKFLVQFFVKKDRKIEKIEASWRVHAWWLTTSKSKIISKGKCSECFKNSYSKGTYLPSVPDEKSLMNISVEITSWVVTNTDNG